VLARVSAEGPVRSADFEHPERRGPWWGWKPTKAALDYLWRTGELAVTRREQFQKLYDLPHRVLPQVHAHPESDPETLVEWACATAAERLVIFTEREMVAFWALLELAEGKAWCARAAREGRLLPAVVEAADGAESQRAWVLADWETRLAALPEPPPRIRLLSPFDPILRDRARALRRFAFDYRFEAFVPEPRRRYGYYVLPILEEDRLVGRLDPKFHRDRGLLEVRGLWWEEGVRPTRTRLARLRGALERLAAFLGASDIASG
jgi:uncharacterized protein